jgi:hypothetical protein
MKEIPPHIKEKIDKLTDELKRVYELAEQSWEGCDGCDENDKNFWIKGFQAGYNTAKPDEISDEEILKANIEYNNYFQEKNGSKPPHIQNIHIMRHFQKGCEWYREKLKQNTQKKKKYTEEQVRELISLIRTELVKNQYNHYSINYEEILQSLKKTKKN